MQEWLDWIRVGVTVATFICFVAWIVWFLNKDNATKYQARAAMLLDDDDTTPVQIDESNQQQSVKK